MRDERGEITIVQMLIAMALMLGILGATLTVFTTAERVNADANVRNETQDQARVALDQMARQRRNLASPTADQRRGIDRAEPFDLIFQAVDPVGPAPALNPANIMRIRYCLGSDGRIYRQEQRWNQTEPPAAPSGTACPFADSGWQAPQVVASSVTNRRDGLDRALFVYDASDVQDIASIHAQLWMDADSDRGPAETSLSSGVFLRNQNRAPHADFTADTSVPGKIILNAALSIDPEGGALQYVWLDNGLKIDDCNGAIRCDVTVTPGSTHQIQLKVLDLADVPGESDVRTVAAPLLAVGG
jgi:hypothetical protein